MKLKPYIAVCLTLLLALMLAPVTSQARYLNPATGRFWTMDSYEGDQEEPVSQHKYIYAADNPVDNVDPSGNEYEAVGMLGVMNISSVLLAQVLPTTTTAPLPIVRPYRNRPGSKRFWSVYPNYISYPESPDAWNYMGGGIALRYHTENSCATRVSWGLNHSGTSYWIPRSAPDADKNWANQQYNGKPGDNRYYIIKARKMQEYLTNKWGQPDVKLQSFDAVKTFVATRLKGERCAVFATSGHSGVLRSDHIDRHVEGSVPLNVWLLNP